MFSFNGRHYEVISFLLVPYRINYRFIVPICYQQIIAGSNSGLPIEYVHTLAIESNGTKWIVKGSGLAQCDGPSSSPKGYNSLKK